MIQRFPIESKLDPLGTPRRKKEMLLLGHPNAEMGRKSGKIQPF